MGIWMGNRWRPTSNLIDWTHPHKENKTTSKKWHRLHLLNWLKLFCADLIIYFLSSAVAIQQINSNSHTHTKTKKESNKIDIRITRKKIIYLDKRTRADVTSLELEVREAWGNGHGLSIYLSQAFFHNQSQVSKVAFLYWY